MCPVVVNVGVGYYRIGGGCTTSVCGRKITYNVLFPKEKHLFCLIVPSHLV
jgi:hypothetical protein